MPSVIYAFVVPVSVFASGPLCLTLTVSAAVPFFPASILIPAVILAAVLFALPVFVTAPGALLVFASIGISITLLCTSFVSARANLFLFVKRGRSGWLWLAVPWVIAWGFWLRRCPMSVLRGGNPSGCGVCRGCCDWRPVFNSGEGLSHVIWGC